MIFLKDFNRVPRLEVYDGIDTRRIPDWTKVTIKDEAAR